MKLAHQVLDHHPINEQRRAEGKRPANGVWFWAEGSAVALESFWEKYHKTGTVISAVPLCFGIARLSGLDIREVPAPRENWIPTMKAGCRRPGGTAQRQGLCGVHVEAPDECTHNGDLPGKLQAIEWLDSRVVGPLTQALAEEGTDYRLLILSDHKTLTATRGHDADPVPYLLYDSRKDTGLGLPYCEESGQKGPAYPCRRPGADEKTLCTVSPYPTTYPNHYHERRNTPMHETAFSPANILLPQDCGLTKWAVVACDQYTSQPEYWERVDQFVGDAPSTLRLILPESKLESEHVEEEIQKINQTMEQYLEEGRLRELEDAMIFLERKLSNGKTRLGLIGKLDLEQYSYEKGSGTPIRATEGTVLSRIPPRMKVRKNAPIELPHIMVLIDDPKKKSSSPSCGRRARSRCR